MISITNKNNNFKFKLLIGLLVSLFFIVFLPQTTKVLAQTSTNPEDNPYFVIGSSGRFVDGFSLDPSYLKEMEEGGWETAVSRDDTDPSKNENESPWSEGLPVIPGYSTSELPQDMSRETDPIFWEEREALLKTKDEQMINIINELEKKREETAEIADKWILFHPLLAATDIKDSRGIAYNRYRKDLIDRMLTSAKSKHRRITLDKNSAQVRAIELRKAVGITNNLDADSLEAIAIAENEAKKNQVEERKEIQQDIITENAIAKGLDDKACWPGGSLTPNLGNCILIATGWVGNIITWVFSLVLWVASKTFDLSVYLSIYTIKNWFSMPAIITVWKLLRDIANLCFVFVLLYIALGTVFELSGMGDTRKLIVSVIVAALFVNFSGFFVRVIVDSTNIIAYEFYKSMGGGGLEVQTIGTKLVKKMGLGTYFIDEESVANAKTNAGQKFKVPEIERLSFIGIIGQTFGNVVIILVTSFVLFTAAILFLIRTMYLLFIYLLSPLAFVSKMIPSSRFNYFDQWLDKLIHQAVVAPAFLIPFYFVFLLLGEGGITSLVVNGGLGNIFVVNIVVIGLLMGCIFIANSLGAAGAKMATSIAGSSTLLGAKGIIRGSRFIGQKTVSPLTKATGRRIGRSISSTATNLSNWADEIQGDIGNAGGPGLIKRATTEVIAKTRYAGQGLGSGASKVWDSKAGKTARNLSREALESAPAQKVADTIKHPLLAASDAIVDLQTAINSGGGGSYSFLGKTGKERGDAEKEKRGADEKKRRKDLNEKLEKQIKTLAKTPPTAASFAEIMPLVTDLDDDTLKLIDLKIFADVPEAACALEIRQIKKLTARKDSLADDAPHKEKIRDAINDPENQRIFGTHIEGIPLTGSREDVVRYMGPSGAGNSLWAS